jgi:2-oxo-4-hydroxy-4-carboxy-5-ureidoimidazoline decarboxylase
MSKLPLAEINSMPAPDFVARFGGIFEHSPWVAERIADRRPFESVHALLEAMIAAVHASPQPEQLALLKSHPDLAGKAARAGALTQASTAEQSSAGLDRLSEREYETFHTLNAGYAAKHGIPFIVCVRRHTKDSILRQFARRLDNDTAREWQTALGEVFRIAALRLDQTIENAGLGLNGRLSTHVLDNHAGKPAPGMAVVLNELSDHDAPKEIVRTRTNADGRTDAPLIAERPVPAGRYELLFFAADYYAEKGVPLAEPAFLDVIPIRFSIAEPEGHYHVPLLVTPWSYATYRGS